MDQATLAARVGVSRSSMSRIFSGLQEPKLPVARAMARELGVGLDFLVAEGDDLAGGSRWESLTEDEMAVLRIVRRLGIGASLDRLLGVAEPGDRADSRTKPRPRRR